MRPETKRVAQVERRRLLHENGIGARFDDEPVGVLGANDAAEA